MVPWGALCCRGQHSSAGSPSPQRHSFHRSCFCSRTFWFEALGSCRSSFLSGSLAGGCCPLLVDVVPCSWEVPGISQLPRAGFFSSIIPLNLGAGRRILMTLFHSKPSVSSVLSCSPLQHELLSSLAASHLIPKLPRADSPCVDQASSSLLVKPIPLCRAHPGGSASTDTSTLSVGVFQSRFWHSRFN